MQQKGTKQCQVGHRNLKSLGKSRIQQKETKQHQVKHRNLDNLSNIQNRAWLCMQLP